MSMAPCQACGELVELRRDTKGRQFYRCVCGSTHFFGRTLTDEEEVGLLPTTERRSPKKKVQELEEEPEPKPKEKPKQKPKKKTLSIFDRASDHE